MYKYELSIVIPFYNEEENVADVVSGLNMELSKNKINYEMVLVNNGSTDNTQVIIKSFRNKNNRIKQIDISLNEGYGWGIMNGLDASRGEYIGFIDGDNQVGPEQVILAFNAIRKSNADICISRRNNRQDNLKRKLISRLYNIMLNLTFLLNLKDVNSKPKLMRSKIYKDMEISSKDWFIDTEMLIKAKKMNCRIVEIPIRHNQRMKGKSKVKFMVIAEFLSNIIKRRFRL